LIEKTNYEQKTSKKLKNVHGEVPNKKQKQLMQQEHEKLNDLLLSKLLLYQHTFLNNDSELKVSNYFSQNF